MESIFVPSIRQYSVKRRLCLFLAIFSLNFQTFSSDFSATINIRCLIFFLQTLCVDMPYGRIYFLLKFDVNFLLMLNLLICLFSQIRAGVSLVNNGPDICVFLQQKSYSWSRGICHVDPLGPFTPACLPGILVMKL